MAVAVAASAPIPMRNAYIVAALTLSMAAPQVTTAQSDLRRYVDLVSLQIDASALGRRVLLEVGLALDIALDLPENTEHASSSVARRADRALQARHWALAAELWQQVVLADDAQPNHWNAYAQALYNDNRYRDAIGAFEQAIRLGLDRPAPAAVCIARAYAHLGNRKQALRWVERAVDLGAPRRALREDAEFERYRDDARFKELVGPINQSGEKLAHAGGQVRVLATAWPSTSDRP